MPPVHTLGINMIQLILIILPVTQGLTQTELAAITSHGEVGYTTEGNYYVMTSDGIPNHDTDDFPTSYNPNSIQSKNYQVYIPINPEMASSAQCLPGGPIGMSISGVPFFNPLTSQSLNAVEGEDRELFDGCSGHPDGTGTYHYHQLPECVSDARGDNKIIGFAYDGFPIYSQYSDGVKLTSDDLDDCHGRLYKGEYRYHVTDECPYVLGCFKGTLHSSNARGGRSCAFVTPSSSYCTAGDDASNIHLSIVTVLGALFTSVLLM